MVSHAALFYPGALTIAATQRPWLRSLLRRSSRWPQGTTQRPGSRICRTASCRKAKIRPSCRPTSAKAISLSRDKVPPASRCSGASIRRSRRRRASGLHCADRLGAFRGRRCHVCPRKWYWRRPGGHDVRGRRLRRVGRGRQSPSRSVPPEDRTQAPAAVVDALEVHNKDGLGLKAQGPRRKA